MPPDLRSIVRRWLGLPQENDWFFWVEHEVRTMISDTDRLMRQARDGELCSTRQKSESPSPGSPVDMPPEPPKEPCLPERDPSSEGSP